MEEPKYGGLIDKSFYINWIIIPIITILSLIGILKLIDYSCPYTEDVSSCFPYNLPNWIKIILPLFLILIPIAIIFLIKLNKSIK